MEGDLNNKNEYGVIPRSATAIFDELQKNPNYISSSVYCSLLEIYNEELSDLILNTTSSNNTNVNNGSSRGGGASSSSTTTATTKLAIMEGENGPFCRYVKQNKTTTFLELSSPM
jgi:hypothetical protein